MSEISMNSPPEIDGRRQRMRTPDEVVAILRLHDGGWGTRKIAWEVGCDRETVKRYLASGRWASCRVSKRPGVLDEHAGWTGDAIRLAGVTTAELKAHAKDITLYS